MNKIKRLFRYDLPLHFVLFITNWLPDNVIFIRLRGWLATPFFMTCGKRLGIGRNVTFYNSKNIIIGDDVYIAKGCWFNAGSIITICSEVMFGPYCVVVTSKHTFYSNSYRFGKSINNPINIGFGSWIAAHVTIVGGVNIMEGVLVAANSVVNKSIESHTVVAGSPAKFIRKS